MNRFEVRFTEEAREDLIRLFDFLLQFDLDVALRARQTIEDSLTLLEQFPFTCRKAANGAHGPACVNSLFRLAQQAMWPCLKLTMPKR